MSFVDSFECPWCHRPVLRSEEVSHIARCSALGTQAEVARAFALLPSDSAVRKQIPLASGVLDYFSAALGAVAEVSWAGNEKHNPGEPLHWSREKSNDHDDCLMRHFLERGSRDTEDGLRHSAKMAWRALAILQLELEAAGFPRARAASYHDDSTEEKK